MRRNTGRPRNGHGKKKEWGGRQEPLPRRLREGPSVEERMFPRETFTMIGSNDVPAAAKSPWCPECAVLGTHTLLSAAHWRDQDGAEHTDYACTCGYTRKVVARPNAAGIRERFAKMDPKGTYGPE